MFENIYNKCRVLVTGHSGFKGSWLCAWLKMLGADVCGISLPMDTEYCHSDLLQLNIRSEMCDICDLEKIQKIFSDFEPEIVFHLAAQPLVRMSYEFPVKTFESNVIGTVNVLEAARHTKSVRAIVAISSDKCYENKEQLRGYREDDPMGGYDPYSASKGCTELVISSYRRSFFSIDNYQVKHSTLLASARAGNVIGGGDWATDRLVPDLMKAAAKGVVSEIRSPNSTRPWQHVLEPLSGYLLLGLKLLKGQKDFADGWNFGPNDDGIITVEEAASALAKYWSGIKFKVNPPQEQPHEAILLRLDCSKARNLLNWHGVLTPEESFEMTSCWYQKFYNENKIETMSQIKEYIALAEKRGLQWTK